LPPELNANRFLQDVFSKTTAKTSVLDYGRGDARIY
jgi:hypothetical protein